MTHRGAVSESFYLEAPYFNMGIAYQTKAKRLSEMTVTTKKPYSQVPRSIPPNFAYTPSAGLSLA